MKLQLSSNSNKLMQAFLILVFFALVHFSCEQNAKSELIKKVNAVQQQMMIQGNISEEEELAILSLCSLISGDEGIDNYHPENSILFKDVENPPIYDACEGHSPKEAKACFNKNLSTFIKREFNLNIAKNLKLSEPKQVAAFFTIDEKGKLSGIKIRDAEVNIQAEIISVLKKIPTMKPAMQDGINVPVLCSILVTYGNEVDVDVVYIPEGPNEN